jgi:hypothetical protein
MKIWTQLNLFWNHSLSFLVRFYENSDKFEIRGTSLVLGPLAFVVCWRVKKPTHYTDMPRMNAGPVQPGDQPCGNNWGDIE